MSKKGKIISIVIASILIFCCAVIDGWYLYILLYGNEKVASKTFNVGTLTLADGTQKDIIEIEYFANKDNSGYEAFEIKYNYFMDETKENVYAQGFQYIANTGTSIGIEYSHNDVTKTLYDKNYNVFTGTNKHYNCQNSYVPTSNTNIYNYMYSTIDDNGQYIRSTNPIGLDTRFKIEIGKDIYLMQFKGVKSVSYNETDDNGEKITMIRYAGTPLNESTYIKRTKDNGAYTDNFHHQYYIYDAQYFSKLLYESVKTLKLGTDQNIIFEFGNLFNYYAYDAKNGVYVENPTDYSNVKTVSGDIKSYYSIRVKTHEYGLSRSKDSLFGSILGNQNINLNDNNASENYFIGRTIVNCNLGDFNLVTVDENNVALKLNDSFIDYYTQYKDSIALSVVIDLDLLESLGYTFVGFTADSGLDKFNIHECYTTSGGEFVEDYTTSLKVVNV